MMALMDSAATNRQIHISASEYERLKIRQAEWRKDFVFTEDVLQKMRKPRRFTDNMRKPKTLTDKLKAEHERRKSIGFYKGENNACYGTHFKWYNDGIKNYRIDGNPPAGLIPGKIQKIKVFQSYYVINDLEFHSEKEVYNFMKSSLTFSTWKRKNIDFLKSIKLNENGRDC